MDMEKRSFSSVCDVGTDHQVQIFMAVLSSRAFKALWGYCFWNRAVLEACVLHRVGVWISATESGDGAKAGTC